MPESPRSGVTANEAGHHTSGGRNVISAETALGETDIFRAAVQMSRMPMCLTDPDGEDNPIIFCNQAFEQLTGYSQEEILGRNCRFLQGEGTDREAAGEIRLSLEARQDVHIELLNYRKDGTPFWNALFISPVIDTTGRLVYFFASQLDVSRRREAEAVLQQSQRVETLGAMASSVAHEFNNLMTVVLANLERLEGEQDPIRRARQLSRARWGAERATKLTDQMLSFARRQFHDNQVLDVNATIAGCDTILDQMAGSGSTVRLELAPEPLLASLDASQLEMALLNLVRNAADASIDGGTVIVSTQRRSQGEQDGEPRIEIAVVDRGSGMDDEVVRRAIEPFFTTKVLGKGTGLGLSMVKGFVEQSGGTLEIESGLGQGTTIRLVFPTLHHADTTVGGHGGQDQSSKTV